MYMLARFNYHFVRITWHLRALYLMLVTLIMAGAVVIVATEKVSFGKAVYFAFITGLTVGYGDIAAAVQSVRYAWEETQSQSKQNQN
jgi:hypothetical protein